MSRVIFLHGASSSGKTTLARALRAASPLPFVHLSLDHFRDSGAIDPAAYANWPDARPRVFDGLHRAFSGFADAGNDVIVEHILDTDGWQADLRDRLARHHVLFVGVMTPPDVLSARELARGDREPGSAVCDHDRIHQGLVYDLTLDGTACAGPNARRILRALDAPPARSRFFD